MTGDNGESAVSEPAFFETAKMQEPWQAIWVGPAVTDTYHPVLKKEFTAEKGIDQARLYICGVGLYEAYVNGERRGMTCLHRLSMTIRSACNIRPMM